MKNGERRESWKKEEKRRHLLELKKISKKQENEERLRDERWRNFLKKGKKKIIKLRSQICRLF